MDSRVNVKITVNQQEMAKSPTCPDGRLIVRAVITMGKTSHNCSLPGEEVPNDDHLHERSTRSSIHV